MSRMQEPPITTGMQYAPSGMGSVKGACGGQSRGRREREGSAMVVGRGEVREMIVVRSVERN